ncbi:MAG: polysaccharide biosynthesis C-terminal domain-containing protein [Bacteroidetes bacterium]|nr:polysaccharide biosynthesis C-terminal domain-containing protein [Bacteroidota bacterium]
MNKITNLSITRGFQIFQLFRFAALLFTGILLSKSNIAIQDIGVYEGLIFISGAVSFFWVNGILNGLLSQYKKEEINRNVYFFNTALLLVFMSIILILIMTVFSQTVAHFLPSTTQRIYGLMLIYIFLNNPTFLIEHIFLLKENTMGLLMYGILHTVAYISAVLIPVWMGWEIEFVFYGLILLSIFKNSYLGILIYKENVFKINKKVLVDLLSYSTPLIFSFALAGSAEYIDGLLVASHFGSDQFAIFRYGARELPLAVLLSSSLSSSFIPRLSQNNLRSELSNLKAESLKLMNLLFPITILLVCFSHWLYPLIFRAEFSASAPIFNTYLLLLVSRVLFPQTLVLANGKTKVIMQIAVFELIINFISSYFLMIKFGIIGIAVGTLIAFYAEKFLLIFFVKRNLKVNLNEYLAVNRWIIYSLVLFLVYFLTYTLSY